MGLTYQQAYDQTDPDAEDAARARSAQVLMQGAHANAVYWNSRSELEALRAEHDGHGLVRRAVEEPTRPDAIDATATEDTLSMVPPPDTGPEPTTDHAVARLRAQLVDAGLEPEA